MDQWEGPALVWLNLLIILGVRMGEGVVFVLVAAAWFVFRKRIAAYQVFLITEKFKILPVRDKAEQLRAWNCWARCSARCSLLQVCC